MLHSDWEQVRIARFLSELPEMVAWSWGRRLISFGFKVKEASWLLTVKVAGLGKGHIVFIEADSILRCLECFWVFCENPPYSGYRWLLAKW